MTDSTNPRVMADNIRELSNTQAAQGAKLEDEIEALGFYSTNEVDTGMKYGNDKIYRKVFFVEAMPDTTTLNIPHEIANLGHVLRLDGIMQTTVTVAGLPFPYGTSYLLRYNNSNISIQTTGDYSSNSAIIVFEYTKAAPEPTPDVTPSPDPDTRALEKPETEPEPIEEKK